jgi:tRNA threonylcarbamoyladenosine biosynthesis protein TsaB
MQEVYFGSYARSGGLATAQGAEAIGPPASVGPPAAPFLAVGDGLAAYPETLAPVLAAASRSEATLSPRAQDLWPLALEEIRQGRFLALEAALPVYLRGADAWHRS